MHSSHLMFARLQRFSIIAEGLKRNTHTRGERGGHPLPHHMGKRRPPLPTEESEAAAHTHTAGGERSGHTHPHRHAEPKALTNAENCKSKLECHHSFQHKGRRYILSHHGREDVVITSSLVPIIDEELEIIHKGHDSQWKI